MKKRHQHKYSALREQLRREDVAEMAKLTPAERLRMALDFSDFCLMLAARVRQADAQRGSAESRATKDVDLLVDWPLQEGASLAHSLGDNGLSATFHRGKADDPVAGVIRVVVPTPAATIKCDILFPSEAWQVEAVRKATRVRIPGQGGHDSEINPVRIPK